MVANDESFSEKPCCSKETFNEAVYLDCSTVNSIDGTFKQINQRVFILNSTNENVPPSFKCFHVQTLTKEMIILAIHCKCKVSDVLMLCCEHFGLKDSHMLGLALRTPSDGIDGVQPRHEFLFLRHEQRLEKYAAKKSRFKYSRSSAVEKRPFIVLYLRIRIYVDDLRLIRCQSTLKYYYLQLRENLLDQWAGPNSVTEERCWEMASLAFQVDNVDWSNIRVEQYFPLWAINIRGLEFVRRNITNVITDWKHYPDEEAIRRYCTHASRNPLALNCHLHGLRRNKVDLVDNALIGISPRGINISNIGINGERFLIRSLPWGKIRKLNFSKKKLSIEGVDCASISFYAQSECKARYILQFCRAFHQAVISINSQICKNLKAYSDCCSKFPVVCDERNIDERISKYSFVSSYSSNSTSGFVSDKPPSDIDKRDCGTNCSVSLDNHRNVSNTVLFDSLIDFESSENEDFSKGIQDFSSSSNRSPQDNQGSNNCTLTFEDRAEENYEKNDYNVINNFTVNKDNQEQLNKNDFGAVSSVDEETNDELILAENSINGKNPVQSACINDLFTQKCQCEITVNGSKAVSPIDTVGLNCSLISTSPRDLINPLEREEMVEHVQDNCLSPKKLIEQHFDSDCIRPQIIYESGSRKSSTDILADDSGSRFPSIKCPPSYEDSIINNIQQPTQNLIYNRRCESRTDARSNATSGQYSNDWPDSLVNLDLHCETKSLSTYVDSKLNHKAVLNSSPAHSSSLNSKQIQPAIYPCRCTATTSSLNCNFVFPDYKINQIQSRTPLSTSFPQCSAIASTSMASSSNSIIFTPCKPPSIGHFQKQYCPTSRVTRQKHTRAINRVQSMPVYNSCGELQSKKPLGMLSRPVNGRIYWYHSECAKRPPTYEEAVVLQAQNRNIWNECADRESLAIATNILKRYPYPDGDLVKEESVVKDRYTLNAFQQNRQLENLKRQSNIINGASRLASLNKHSMIGISSDFLSQSTSSGVSSSVSPVDTDAIIISADEEMLNSSLGLELRRPLSNQDLSSKFIFHSSPTDLLSTSDSSPQYYEFHKASLNSCHKGYNPENIVHRSKAHSPKGFSRRWVLPHSIMDLPPPPPYPPPKCSSMPSFEAPLVM